MHFLLPDLRVLGEHFFGFVCFFGTAIASKCGRGGLLDDAALVLALKDEGALPRLLPDVKDIDASWLFHLIDAFDLC